MPTQVWLCVPKHAETLSPVVAFSLSPHHRVCSAASSSKICALGRCLSVWFKPQQHSTRLTISLPPPDTGPERNQPHQTFPPHPGALGFLQRISRLLHQHTLGAFIYFSCRISTLNCARFGGQRAAHRNICQANTSTHSPSSEELSSS